MKSKILLVTSTLKGNNSTGIEGKQIGCSELVRITTKRPMSHYKIFSEERQRGVLLWPEGQHAGHQQDEPGTNASTQPWTCMRYQRQHEGPAKGNCSDQGTEKLPCEHESRASAEKSQGSVRGIKIKATKSQVVWMEYSFPKSDPWNTCPYFFLGQISLGIL